MGQISMEIICLPGSLLSGNQQHRLWLHKHKWTNADGKLATAHGLRSSFKDWSDDAGGVDMMLSETCLQHVKGKGDQTARAYFRTDQLERRREVMEQWSVYVVSKQEERALEARVSADFDRQMERIIAEEEGRAMTAADAAKWARFDGLEHE